MKRTIRIFLVVTVSCVLGLIAYADRGGFVKKEKRQLNIESYGTLKNSIQFNLKSGLKYKGSDILSMQKVGGTVVTESIVTYKKGNTVYIVPYKQRIVTSEYSQKEGYKLILRSR